MNDDSVVTLHELHFGVEEDGEWEVGRPETGQFVRLPVEGVALLELLSLGLRLAEVRERFADRFGAEPELDEFLEGIGECGFVASVDGQVLADPLGPAAPRRGLTLLANVRQERVAWLVTRPMLALYLAVWVAVPVLLLADPRLLPRPSDALPFDGALVNAVTLGFVGWGLVLLHECAHAIIARALGCTGSLSLSRRLYFLVAQTDVSGVRSAPRRRRYAVFLAGMTWDLAVMLGCLAGQLLGLSGPAEQLARAVAYALALSVIFQFQVFMRTDMYYVLVNWLRLGNLMEDTRHWLADAVRSLVNRPPRHDMSLVPARELRIVRWYAPFYLLGSAAAFAVLGLLTVPALSQMVDLALRGIGGGPSSSHFWDGLGFLLLVAFQLAALAWVFVVERRDRRGGELSVGSP
ncbi:hypothetical protein [Nonomuraea sp. NPDC049709]|uniref:hypothetical protein n=1 Tax=Nonomuraea sp. NPDC049709 TaxID=3154736 RepID=UPI00344AA7B8